MITNFQLRINDDKQPQNIKWSEEQGDYIIDGLNGLTIIELFEVVEEIKRITKHY